jgi:hypothetical protein
MFPSLIRHPILCGSSAVVFFLAATPALAVECSDLIDNDGDGLVDFPDDPGCADALQDIEDPECSDGGDNDRDILVDFPLDPGCTSQSDLSERELGLACDDGIDNDGDGSFDFHWSSFQDFALTDRGCESVIDADERSPDLPCDDGIDNDGDGFIDFPSDPGCGTASWRTEAPDCDDGIDNDGDGPIDHPLDGDCTGGWDFSERPRDCADGVDNDGDGLVDSGEDPGCLFASDFFELTEVPIMGGAVTGYACEATAMNCEAQADFAVTSATVGAGGFSPPAGKGTYVVDFEVPQIILEGGFGDVARVEFNDLAPGGRWWSPFEVESIFPSYIVDNFNGTIQEFDGSGAPLANPVNASFSMADVFENSISYCTVAQEGETGRCELFLDTLHVVGFVGADPHPLIGGTPHRIALQFDLTLNTVPDFDGDGVMDQLDNCSEAFNPAQDDTDGDFCGNLCDANYDGFGTVGFGDFGAFTAHFGTTDELYQHLEPIGGGEHVGFGDFGFFTAHFGTVPGPSGTTPGTVACP